MNKKIMIDKKEIFVFHDGYKERTVDPLVALRRLHTVPNFNLEYDQKLIVANKPPDCYEALGRLVQAARKAFNLPEYDEVKKEGVLEAKCLEIMTEYAAWMAKKNESGNGCQTLAQPAQQSTKKFQPKKDTKRQSACTSTGDGRKVERLL